MEKITVGEFRRNLKRYLDDLDNGVVFEVRGIKISKFSEKSDKKRVHGFKMEDYETSIPVTDADIGFVHEEKLGPELFDSEGVLKDECELCDNLGIWTFWEEGEERVVCDGCVRKGCASEKVYNMVIKNYRKIGE